MLCQSLGNMMLLDMSQHIISSAYSKSPLNIGVKSITPMNNEIIDSIIMSAINTIFTL